MKYSILAALLIAVPGRALIAKESAPAWESAARFHRLLKKSLPGKLAINAEGVEFRSDKFSRRWSFEEIHTFDLSNLDLTLTIYQNRHWHEPGEQQFHFTMQEDMPPSVASMLTERVGRPVRNGAPDAKAPALAEIPARRTARFGGSNGTLRLRDSGIDYVSADGRDSRSWRWSDIETIANPDPYSFRVTAYREISEFELKQPLARELFDKIWTMLYAGDLNLSTGKGDSRL